MNLDFLHKVKGKVYSSRGLVVLVIVFLISILGSLIFNSELSFKDLKLDVSPEVEMETEIKSSNSIEGPILEKSFPTRLRIPKLNIDTNFVEPLGLEDNGEVSVPDSYTEVGWYKHSPTPGQLGPAIVLGHVDSHTGPAIFFYLGQLKEGDDVYIDREDGTSAQFKIEKLERYKQSEFPTELVYGNINYAGLRLITCSGIFSKGEQRYSHNLVVYARLVDGKE